MRTDIFGVGFDDLGQEAALARAMDLLRESRFSYVVTPNPELVNYARAMPDYRDTLNGAALVLPDGIGVVHAARILGTPLKFGRVPGIDFATALLPRLAEENRSLYLLGAKPGIAETAAANLLAARPNLHICGTADGYFSDSEAVAMKIRESGADVVFVCLGAPKQERWMAEFGEKTGARLMLGLGGVLDVYAGAAKRAPKGFQKLGLEWFYRLLREPRRIGRMAKLPLFLGSALLLRIRRGSGG